MAKHLIITADDLGYSEERNDGIVDCFKQGIITRASLLVNGVAASGGVELAQSTNMPIGLHLNLTEGNPISPVGSVPTLVNGQGFMLGKFGFREALTNKQINIAEVQTEIEAQISEFARLCGHAPKWIDGHQHVHILPGIREVFAKVLKDKNIPETRLPIDRYVGDCDWLEQSSKIFLQSVAKDAEISVKIFQEAGIRFPDTFVGLTTMGSYMTLERLKHQLLIAFNSSHDPVTSCEMMSHPGYPCMSGNGGCGDGPDDFAKSYDRKHEIDVLNDKKLKEFYAENSITLVPYVSEL